MDDAYLRVFVLGQILELSLQFRCDLVSFFLASMFHDRLHNTTGIVLEDNIRDSSTNDVHQVLDMFRSFGRWNIFLSSKSPDFFGIYKQGRMGFRSTALLLEKLLCLVRFTSGCIYETLY